MTIASTTTTIATITTTTITASALTFASLATLGAVSRGQHPQAMSERLANPSLDVKAAVEQRSD